MSDIRDRLVDAPTDGRYSELGHEQTATRPKWYDGRTTRIALCVATVVIVCIIVLIPLILSRGGESIIHHEPAHSSSSSTAAPVGWSSSSTGGIEPLYVANVTFAGMEGRQFGSDASPHVVITMPNVFGVGRELYNLSQTFAEHGFRVYAMDIFRGEPMPRSWDPSWWGRHHYNDTVADMVTVIDAMYQHATNAPIASLQLAGYCYGGGVAAGLTAVLDRPVLSAVSAHPTWEDPQGNSELGELETLVDNGSSLFFVMPYNDPQFNNQAMRWINASIHRNIETQYKIYKNTQHGFAFDIGGSSWNSWNWTQRASATRDTLYWLQTHTHVMPS